MSKQWKRTGLALAAAACLALVAGATAIATSPSGSAGEGLDSKAAAMAAWPDEKKAAWNAGLDEKVAYLAEQGMTVETTELAPGVRGIVWTDELKSALKDLGSARSSGSCIPTPRPEGFRRPRSATCLQPSCNRT